MARYFFDQENSFPSPDEVGVDLADQGAACVMALKVLAQALERDPLGFWATGMHVVAVRDDQGLSVLRLDLTGTLAPIARTKGPPKSDEPNGLGGGSRRSRRHLQGRDPGGDGRPG